MKKLKLICLKLLDLVIIYKKIYIILINFIIIFLALKECKGKNHFVSGEVVSVKLIRSFIKIQERFYKENKEEYLNYKKEIEKMEKEIKKLKNPDEAELQEK